jgi:lipopolysaccharide assembly outer membrane protein LptD (OstA)
VRTFVLAAILACLPQAVAQEQPSEEIKHLLATGPEFGAVVSALNIERGADYPSVIRLRGKVEIRMRGVLLAADEVDYDEATGDMEPRGHVHVKVGRY